MNRNYLTRCQNFYRREDLNWLILVELLLFGCGFVVFMACSAVQADYPNYKFSTWQNVFMWTGYVAMVVPIIHLVLWIGEVF